MELAATLVSRRRALATAIGFDRPAAGAWLLGLAPVLYLALRGGGYDTIVYGETGLAAWWIVLIGVLAGVLPLSRIGRLAWAASGLLAAFAVWTLIAVGWSESVERTVTEVGRIATYLGFFVLGLCVLRRNTMRPFVNGMGVAFGVVGLLAVLSRLYPGAFPQNGVLALWPNTSSRLNYPFNYANGTGNFLAIGLPLLLATATRVRTIPFQAIAASAIPVSVLGLVMTASRGGVLTAVIAIVCFYALAPDRLPRFATGLVAAGGSAILIVALLNRPALRDGLAGPTAIGQRHQFAVLLVIVCAGVAMVQAGIALTARYAARPSWLRIPRRVVAGTALGALAVALAIGIAFGVPGKLAHQWNVFKETDVTGVAPSNVYTRLGTLSGSHRYQYWTTALHAFESKPLTGIGPGTFQFYWAQHGPIHEYILNAHSLYLETLAEAGIIGFVLIVSFLAVLLAAGVWVTLRAPPLARASLAGATAALIGFCLSAGYDWMWQLPAAPVAALLLGAAILAYRAGSAGSVGVRLVVPGWRGWARPAAAGAVALAAMIAIAIPFATSSAITSSQAEVRAGHLNAALGDANTAVNLEPYAATPRLQQALILELDHDFAAARAAIARATAREPANYQLWLIRARIDAESGYAGAAIRDYQQAHTLNPLSPLTAING